MKDFLKKKILLFLLPLILFSGFLLVAMVVGIVASFVQQENYMATKSYYENQEDDGIYTDGTLALSPEVESYRTAVYTEALKYGRGEYVDLFLAVMMQESCGKYADLFQCSESMGLPRNTLTQTESIEQGVKLLSSYLTAAGVTSTTDISNIRLALQAYNFGGGFIKFAQGYGGWSQEATNAYAEKYSKGKKRSGVKAEQIGQWNYGDQYYTDHVLRYYILSSAEKSDVVKYAMTFLGCPYEYGATGPDSFDCSGFVYYVFKNTNTYNGERGTAASYKAIATPVSEEDVQPGDLVFFKNSSGKVHHVGIYIGDGKMIHAPKTGDVVKISNVYRKNETITYGRLGN